MRVAAVQLNSTDNKRRNLEVAERLVREAAGDGAALVVLPEKWTILAGPEQLREGAEPLDGPTVEAVRSWARELGIHLVAGSFAERVAGEQTLHNTSVMIAPSGEITGVYRESDTEEAGEKIVTVPGPEEVEVGLTVCYDLRFPELYRILAVGGARVLTVPSAFTVATGRDHWQVLLRARAIENQAFVIGANQIGKAPPHYESYGRSAIVDPWGVVLAVAPDRECFVAADLDLGAQDEVRRTLPSLANRRAQAYRWPEMTEAHA
jgi:predicted amidohydrolase